MHRRLLITGATGFVGAATLRALDASRYDVHAVYASTPPPPVPGVTWHRADLFDPAAVDALFADVRAHTWLALAWYMRERDHLTRDVNLDWVRSTVQQTQRFAENGGRRAIYGGTYAEYGVFEGLCREDAPVAPVSLYARCKNALREIVTAYLPGAGAEAVWARIFTAYGRADAPYRLIPYAIGELLSGRRVEATEGTQVRDFICVEDVGSALAALIDAPVTGVVNVGTGHGHRVADVLNEIGRLTGRPEAIRLGARKQSPGESQEVVADVSTLRAAGWQPAYDLTRGLQASVDWYRALREAAR